MYLIVDQLQTTNRGFLYSKCGGGNQHRAVFNSLCLNLGGPIFTQAHPTHYENDTPGKRAAED